MVGEAVEGVWGEGRGCGMEANLSEAGKEEERRLTAGMGARQRWSVWVWRECKPLRHAGSGRRSEMRKERSDQSNTCRASNGQRIAPPTHTAPHQQSGGHKAQSP